MQIADYNGRTNDVYLPKGHARKQIKIIWFCPKILLNSEFAYLITHIRRNTQNAGDEAVLKLLRLRIDRDPPVCACPLRDDVTLLFCHQYLGALKNGGH